MNCLPSRQSHEMSSIIFSENSKIDDGMSSATICLAL